jgi:hypothetical protein
LRALPSPSAILIDGECTRRAEWPAPPSLAAADELVRIGHRFDRVLRVVEHLLEDEHLLRAVSELGRMLVDGRLELRRDPG